MSLRIQVLSSGSSGNAALYSAGSTHILIDCGLSARAAVMALRRAGVEPGQLSGVFVTHEHTDHVQGLRVFLRKRKIPLFAAPECHEAEPLALVEPWHREHLRSGQEVRLGEMCITPFSLPHDAACCYGYVVEAGGIKAVQATDLGHPTALVREKIRGGHCLLLEFNHDVDRLMNGSYPLHVKMRVRGNLGHLSNDQAAKLVQESANGETQALFLMHLSRENNIPELAVVAARGALGGRPMRIEVAKHLEPVAPWEG